MEGVIAMHKGGREPFEGPERKLEVVLNAPKGDFRRMEHSWWRKVVAASGAAVLSRMGNRVLDACLLSESSLFVWSDRLLLITCGETNPLNALPILLERVPVDDIARVFYSRQSFLFPQQRECDFEAELTSIVSPLAGKSFRIGPANGDHLHLFYTTHTDVGFRKDPTVEVLMHGLPEDVLAGFSSPVATPGHQRRKRDLVKRLCSGMRIDHHFFSPHGYSLNAIRGRRYLTVHVTPQRPGSYASVAAAVVPGAVQSMLQDTVDLFRPTRFTLVLTTSMGSRLGRLRQLDLKEAPYAVTEFSRYEFDCGHAVSFANFVRVGELGTPLKFQVKALGFSNLPAPPD